MKEDIKNFKDHYHQNKTYGKYVCLYEDVISIEKY